METWALILIPICIVILIILSALFSSSETALSSADLAEINSLSKSSKKKVAKRARNVIFLVEDFNGTITSILVFNNIVNIINTALVTLFFESLFGSAGVIIAVVLMTILIITFSEILPKIFAKKHAVKFSLRIAPIIKVAYFITSPVNWFFKTIVKDDDYIGTDATKKLINEISHLNEQGGIQNKNAEWLKNLANIQEIKAKDVMINYKNVKYIQLNTSHKKILELFTKYKFSRVPILSLDNKSIIGILNMKIYFSLYASNPNEKIDIKKIMTKPIFIDSDTNLAEALHILQSNGKYFGIIIKSKSKKMMGIITVEDIMEQVIGGLSDTVSRIDGGIEKLGVDVFIVQKDAKASNLFDKFLTNVARPKNITKNMTFYKWFCNTFDVNELIDGNHYSYNNISIWIKTKENDSTKYFEIDLH